ncbi:MAG: hypothetical protein M9895_14555 [Aquamicrobium sp.]|uniref:hypothetical protein n=1 Tax=Aquamicrobium sp. TaxID=1872579 RepID=UPI00349E747B|nr:hypothetical protein [Aquamicrobium sp.]MCO5155564.1 hypothetical protein [Aquamicrobium sp.]
MEVAPLRSYRLEFAKRAADRREEERRIHQHVKDKEERDKKREQDTSAEHDALLDMAITILATEAEFNGFMIELDEYDAATVKALMENDEQLKQVREELKILLDKAYVLPDGRRVFKTEDGTRVFDEHGVEVEDIDPDMIEDWRPHWELYQNPFEREADLVQQRDDILEFQKLADETRAEARRANEAGGMNRERLQELREKLADEAPDAVKRQLPQDHALALDDAEPETQPEAVTFRPAGKLDMPAI